MICLEIIFSNRYILGLFQEERNSKKEGDVMKKKIVAFAVILSMFVSPTSLYVHASEGTPQAGGHLLGSSTTDAVTMVNDLFVDSDPTKGIKATTNQAAIDAAQLEVDAVSDETERAALQKNLQRAKDLLELENGKAGFYGFTLWPDAAGWSATIDVSQRAKSYTVYINGYYAGEYSNGRGYYLGVNGGTEVITLSQGTALKDGDVLSVRYNMNGKGYEIDRLIITDKYDTAKAATDALFLDNTSTNEIQPTTNQLAIDAAQAKVDKVTNPTKNAELNAEIAKAQAQLDMLNGDKEAPTADTVTQTLDKGAAIPEASTFLTNIHDNADGILPNNIAISYVIPPTTSSIGVRTVQIAIKDRAGNTAIKDVTYIVKDDTVAIDGDYVIHSADAQLQTSDLEGKNAEQITELLRQKTDVLGWNSATGQNITSQITLESPVPQTKGTYELVYKLGTATMTSHVVITDNTTFTFTETPAELGFESTEITSSETTIARADTDWNIGVKDLRNNGTAWSVTATVNGPFQTAEADAKKLPDALTFTQAGTETRIKDNQAFTIYNGQSDAQTEKNISWAKDQGIRMKINPTGVKADAEYQTSVTWTLNDTP